MSRRQPPLPTQPPLESQDATSELAGKLAQACLWSGMSDSAEAALGYLRGERWPRHTHFIWAVSDRAEHHLWGMLMGAARDLMERGHLVTFYRTVSSTDFTPWAPTRHHKVAELYTQMWQRVDRPWCLTIEDDNVPAPGLLAALWASMAEDVAAVAAVYRIKTMEHWLNCHIGPGDAERWVPQPAATCPREVFETPFVGAGATLWQTLYILAALPFKATEMRGEENEGWVDGWDGHLGRALHRAGRRVLSDGRLWVRHDNSFTRTFLEKNNLKI